MAFKMLAQSVGLPGCRAILVLLTVWPLAGALSAAAEDARPLESAGPRPIFIGQPVRPEDEDKWSEATGVVTFVGRHDKGVVIELSSGASHMRVTADQASDALAELLLQSWVRVEGRCLGAHGGFEGEIVSSLSTPGQTNITLLQVPEETWQRYPLSTIAGTRTNAPGEIIHLRGNLLEKGGPEDLALSDGANDLGLGFTAGLSEAIGTQIEMLGELETAGSNTVFHTDVYRAVDKGNTGKSPLPLLTTTEQIRWLKPTEARRRYPVKVRVVITFLLGSRTNSAGNLQDGTGGVYAWHLIAAAGRKTIHPGDYCEIDGETAAGDFSPGINCRKIRVVGRGQFPEPMRPTWAEMANGSLDAQWVELRGIVLLTTSQHLEIGRPGGLISCFISGSNNVERYLNSVVRVRGVVAADFDQAGHIYSQHLNVPSEDFISVETPSPADPFSLPAKRIKDLVSYDPGESAFRREKVAGQIVAIRDGIFYLMDGSSGLRVAPKKRGHATVGDTVEAVGFPDIDNSTDPPLLSLGEAVVQVTGRQPLPEPKSIMPSNLVSSVHDSTRVRMDARVIHFSLYGADQVLELQTGVQSFFARLRAANGVVPDLPAGSRVQVTGVYVFNNGKSGGKAQAGPFELLLGSPADVRVLALPSWWTSEHAMMVVSGMTVLMLFALIWIGALRQQVARRTGQLSKANRSLEAEIVERKRTENELVRARLQHLVERERTRIARDIHDELGCSLSQIRLLSEMSLAQNNAPVEIQSNAGKISAKALEATRVLDEIVWAVDPQNDTLESLCNYLFTFASDYLSLAGIRFRIDAPTQIPHRVLTTQVRHQLYMTVKETLTNIVNHADATEVWIRLRLESNAVCFVIEDNGRGFDPANGAAESPGSSGLDNMRQRFHEIGGQFVLESAPDHGTRVQFVLPLADGAKQ